MAAAKKRRRRADRARLKRHDRTVKFKGRTSPDRWKGYGR